MPVVHRPQHSDARMKQRAPTFRSHDQCLYSGLPVGTPEQRTHYWWKVAMLSMSCAIREPAYIKTATINLQTALNLNGLLAQPPEFPGH
jgi:hypothetical protein